MDIIQPQKAEKVLGDISSITFQPFHEKYNLPEGTSICCDQCLELTENAYCEEINPESGKTWCVPCLMKDLYTRNVTKTWGARELSIFYPDHIVEEAVAHATACNSPYIDNVRVAQKDDSEAMDLYQRRRDNGCCGFRDVDWEGPDGELYRVGCNYGH